MPSSGWPGYFLPLHCEPIVSDPYPFESDDDVMIRELEIESVDTFGDQRVTIGQLVHEHESWRFGHVIVDEAQDLTPMQWRMVMRRVRGRALTVVGDLAQRTIGPAGDWQEHLPDELADIARCDLTINYRSPTEINGVVSGLLEEIAPGVTPSKAIRSTGQQPSFVQVDGVKNHLATIVASLRAESVGRLAVIVADLDRFAEVAEATDDDTAWLTPATAKGLEFDTVIVVEPADMWALPGGGAHLYVALTRPTQHLVVVFDQPLPPPLDRARTT